MISDILDNIGSKAAAIAILYPVAVALYAVGFFWGLPKDLIGLFEIGAFLFKASIVYLSAISFLLIGFTLLALAYTPFWEKIEQHEQQIDKSRIPRHGKPWDQFSKRRKLFWGVLSFLILGTAIWAFSIEGPTFRSELDGFVLFFSVVFLGGVLFRPFLSGDVWLAGKILFLGGFAFLIPILIGHSDAQPEDGAPGLEHGEQLCSIVYATPDLTLADCGPTIIAQIADRDAYLVWEKDT